MPPHEPVQDELHGRYVYVVGEPPARVGAQAGHPEPQVAGADGDAHDPSDGDRRVVGQHQAVVEHRAGPELEGLAPGPPHQEVVRSRRPAGLLGEEVGPRTRPLTDRDEVRGVDRPPGPARRAPGGVDLEARRHVLGDGGDVPALDGAGPDGHVRADEHCAPAAVAGPLDNAVEEVLGGLRPPGDAVFLVAVELRADDEGHLRVAEVAEQAFGHAGQRHVIGVDEHDDVVVARVLPEPPVVVAVPGLVGEGAALQLQVAAVLAAKVTDAQPPAHVPDGV